MTLSGGIEIEHWAKMGLEVILDDVIHELNNGKSLQEYGWGKFVISKF